MVEILKRKISNKQRSFIKMLIDKHGSVVSRKQIIQVAVDNNIKTPWWLLVGGRFQIFKVSRGKYNVQNILDAADLVGGNIHIQVVT